MNSFYSQGVGTWGACNIILSAPQSWSLPTAMSPPTMRPFSVDGQRFFLTYPNCRVTPHDLYTFLCTLESVLWARICQETHASGEPHAHAVFQFANRFRSRNGRIFDCDGHHPNIQTVQSVPRALAYVTKEGCYADFGAVPAKRDKRAWSDIVESSQSQDERDWLRTCHEERVQPHVAKRLRELSHSGMEDLDEYDGRPIGSACEEALLGGFRSLLLVGPPGIGKTGAAMKHCPRPCLLVKHMDTLRKFRPDYHKSIFFDDCDFKHYPRSTQLQLCDWENQCQIHVRYGVATIPKHVPRLFACNPGQEPFINDPAIQGRRLQTVNIHTELARL